MNKNLLKCCITLVLTPWLSSGQAAGQEDARAASQVQEKHVRIYIGTYTQGASQGIYTTTLNDETGALERVTLAAETTNPSFLALHPSAPYLYAVNEVGNYRGENTGAVTAFRRDLDSGLLQELNQQPSEGGAPCHLVVDELGKNVLVANYSGGSVAVLPIGRQGRLAEPSAVIRHSGSSVNPRRQAEPHAHSINLDQDNRFAFAADLGIDQVRVYAFDGEHGKLESHSPPAARVQAGAGPRHFAFHPSGEFAYVINELDSTITAFRYDSETGHLETLHSISTLPEGYDKPTSTAEVQVHPSGKFVYGSNRGHDSIAVFAVDPDSGRLSFVEHESTRGRTPRNFGIAPSGKWLLAANQATDDVHVFRIDPETGKLSPTPHRLEVPAPVCIKFAASK